MHWPALRGMVHTMNKATFSAIRLFFAALVLALGACGGGVDESCESSRSRNANGECVEPISARP